MLDSVLGILHNAFTLLFGVYISAAFLGIRFNRRNILFLFVFSLAVGAVYALTFMFFGDHFTKQVYPLIIHLPLIAFLTLFYKYNTLQSALAVQTAYLCCQISKWVGLVVLDFTGLEGAYYGVRIVITVIVFVALIRFVSDAAAQLMQKSARTLLIFALMPFTYYIFDYATGVYTTLRYSGKEVIAEFLGFVLCITYLLFLLVYFRQYEEKREAEQRKRLVEMQWMQSEKEIENFRRSETAVSLLRHDMRHFLLNISSFIDNGENDKAKEYISGIISSVDKTATYKYCKNETVNMILSSYENELKEKNIDFKYSVRIPESLSVSDVDLTSILSNALENAVHAVIPLDEENRHIELDMRMNEDKLLISLKNTFAEKPELIDGIPQSRKAGHGFGTQSICYVTEKLKGNCQFTVKDDWFILRVVM